VTPAEKIALSVTVLNIVIVAAMRWESRRKDMQQAKKDIAGVGGIARSVRDDEQQLELMMFYLSLSVCRPEDSQSRERIMAALFEAATRQKKR
jgi:hypothetical protein